MKKTIAIFAIGAVMLLAFLAVAPMSATARVYEDPTGNYRVTTLDDGCMWVDTPCGMATVCPIDDPPIGLAVFPA